MIDLRPFMWDDVQTTIPSMGRDRVKVHASIKNVSFIGVDLWYNERSWSESGDQKSTILLALTRKANEVLANLRRYDASR